MFIVGKDTNKKSRKYLFFMKQKPIDYLSIEGEFKAVLRDEEVEDIDGK